MKTFSRLFIVFLIWMANEIPSQAWSGPGHAAIAAMAYRQLSVESQQQLTKVLQSHPQFSAWKQEFDAKKSAFPAKLDLGAFLFIRAATWPDDIRGSGNPFDHPNWHFVDYPVQQSDFSTGSAPASPTPNDDILFGIKESLKTIQDSSATPEARAAHLSWLIHLIGDLHQPLHCATLVNGTTYPAPIGDRGGNKFFVSAPGKKTAVKLHTFWDGQLGTTQPHAYQYEKTSEGTTKAAALPGSADDRRAPPIPTGYSKQAEQVARVRVSLAGYRLADTLQALKP